MPWILPSVPRMRPGLPARPGGPRVRWWCGAEGAGAGMPRHRGHIYSPQTLPQVLLQVMAMDGTHLFKILPEVPAMPPVPQSNETPHSMNTGPLRPRAAMPATKPLPDDVQQHGLVRHGHGCRSRPAGKWLGSEERRRLIRTRIKTRENRQVRQITGPKADFHGRVKEMPAAYTDPPPISAGYTGLSIHCWA